MKGIYTLHHPVCQLKIYKNNAWNNPSQNLYNSALFCVFITQDFEHPVFFNKQETPIKNHSIFFLTPYQQILFKETLPKAFTIIQFNFHFFCIETHAAEIGCNGILFNNVFQPPILQCDAAAINTLQQFADAMIQELQQNNAAQKDMLESIMKQLLITAVRFKQQQHPQTPLENTSDAAFVLKFKELLETHYIKEKKLEFYANQFHLSNEQLQRQLKNHFGKTFFVIIQEKVLMNAQRQLFLTNATIKEIAYSLGFEDPAYFNRYFKKYCNATPEDYRNNIRQ